MLSAYKRRRDDVYARLKAMGMDVKLPDGAFYIYPSVAQYGMDADTFCERLMREGKLALIPSSCFGGKDHVRISYCYDDNTLREGMDRLERFILAL